jgi:hypothetical protein
MRHYLRQLRQVQYEQYSATPGPLGPTSSLCYGLQFGWDARGPFPSTAALAAHFHQELLLAEGRAERGWAPSPVDCPPLDESVFAPLVLTHNDLNMRNILLDDHDWLWIVDWAWAGFYPTWFEYLGMRYAAQKDNAPGGWQAAVKFMTEPDFKMEKWMAGIGYGFY